MVKKPKILYIYYVEDYSLRFLKIFPLTVPTDTKENQVVWGMVWLK